MKPIIMNVCVKNSLPHTHERYDHIKGIIYDVLFFVGSEGLWGYYEQSKSLISGEPTYCFVVYDTEKRFEPHEVAHWGIVDFRG